MADVEYIHWPQSPPPPDPVWKAAVMHSVAVWSGCPPEVIRWRRLILEGAIREKAQQQEQEEGATQ